MGKIYGTSSKAKLLLPIKALAEKHRVLLKQAGLK
jgi:hypothetical protein